MEGTVLREIRSFSPSSIGGQQRFKENSLRKQNDALIEFIIGQDNSFTTNGQLEPIFALPGTPTSHRSTMTSFGEDYW